MPSTGSRQDTIDAVLAAPVPWHIDPRPAIWHRAQHVATRLCHELFTPVDISALVVFRIFFGAIMAWEVWRFLSRGWVATYYVRPTFHFTYFGLEWLQPWSVGFMYLHFQALGVLALCVMVGYWYRPAAALFFVGFTYVFLLEQATYLNHLYLVCCISFLMIFVPAHRAFSADARCTPAVRSQTAPAWALWLLRVQIGIPYFYAGLAKLNEDWLRGEPLRMWFADRAAWPIVGPLLTQESVVYLFSYGGLLFDLLIVPFLLWRRTRVLAYGVAVTFHLLNAYLFNIGIFPWFMIAATTLFFSPDWPRRLAAIARRQVRSALDGELTTETEVPKQDQIRPAQYLTLVLLGLYVAGQLLVPLRHFLYPGDVAWTEEGHRFSWRMKLRDKSQTARYFATVPSTGATWEVDPLQYIARWQRDEMAGRPDMILQLSHHMAARLRDQGHGEVEVRARVMASLNGRRRQLLVDPNVNLAAQPRSLLPASWIVPLSQPPRG